MLWECYKGQNELFHMTPCTGKWWKQRSIFFFIINGLNAKEMHGFVHESVCIVDLICSVFKWEQWGIGWIMTMRVENGDGEEA